MAHKKNNSNRRGTALVEAAIIFPILLLLTIGLIEYGWLFLKAQQITNAARSGARVAVRAHSTTADVTQAVSDRMGNFGREETSYTLTITPEEVFGTEPGTEITVRVQVPYANVALMGINWEKLLMPDQISGTVTMSREGP